jgi:amino acid transporter
VLALMLLVCWGLTGLMAARHGGWREVKKVLLDSGVWIGANLILGAIVVGITLIVWHVAH